MTRPKTPPTRLKPRDAVPDAHVFDFLANDADFATLVRDATPSVALSGHAIQALRQASVDFYAQVAVEARVAMRANRALPHESADYIVDAAHQLMAAPHATPMAT